VIAAEDEDISELVEGAGGGEGKGKPGAAAGAGAEDAEAEAPEERECCGRGSGSRGVRRPEGRTQGARGREAKAPAKAAAGRPPRRREADDAGDGRVKASPLARRLASEAGLSLRQVQGSGPGGRITKADIEAALEEGVAEEAPRRGAPAAATPGRAARVRASCSRSTTGRRWRRCRSARCGRPSRSGWSPASARPHVLPDRGHRHDAAGRRPGSG
jgi:pyruvate/2-oxoglutarate dehydrogenase complex dihydrolipoamide acyltransferase (E2) component